jgi:hypothetical protein
MPAVAVATSALAARFAGTHGSKLVNVPKL